MAIKIRRGTDTARLAVIFEEGEVIYTTDTKSFFIGDGVTAGGNQIGGTTAAELLKVEVHNATGSTVAAGAVVYLNGNTGNKPNLNLAKADSEATSSKTIGLVTASISNNANGEIATDGLLEGLNTSAFLAGDLLWLSDSIAGGVTTIIPDTPNNAVFIGYVTYAHPSNGAILIHIQNGYELNELHDVKITSVADGDVLSYDSTLGYWKNIANSSFTPPNGLLKIAAAISTTFQVVKDYLDNASVLFLNSRRVGIGKDTSVTTQSVAVVEVQDANTSIVLKPNGTGGIIASVPDGTVTGGNTRANYALDLQRVRAASDQIVNNFMVYGTILNGQNNKVNSPYGSILSGNTNTINFAGDGYSTIINGRNCTANGDYSICAGAETTASNGSVAIGFRNNITGARSFGLGRDNTVSGEHSSALGLENQSTNAFTFSYGKRATAYLLAQSTHGSANSFSAPFFGLAQSSEVIAIREGSLTTAATTVLSLDGTGVTNLIIPNGNNRAWNVQIDTIAVVTAITGTATGVTVGDCYRETKQLLFKRIGGTSSIVGTVDTSAIKSDSGMSTASITISAGGSQQMAITFTAPNFVGGGSVTCRVVSKVSLVEVAY
jgi:hypothetical protein